MSGSLNFLAIPLPLEWKDGEMPSLLGVVISYGTRQELDLSRCRQADCCHDVFTFQPAKGKTMQPYRVPADLAPADRLRSVNIASTYRSPPDLRPAIPFTRAASPTYCTTHAGFMISCRCCLRTLRSSSSFHLTHLGILACARNLSLFSMSAETRCFDGCYSQ